MGTAVLMRFANGKTLEIKDYSTININRSGRRVDINITNSKNDFALNAIYDSIVTLQGNEKSFAITLQKGEAGVDYDGLVADYHDTGDVEILHLSTITEVTA